MRRILGISFGILTQLFFFLTAYHLFWFLYSTSTGTRGATWWSTMGPRRWDTLVAMTSNCLLALQFAVPHSILLHPTTRRALTPWISQAFYGCMFCCVTCASLWWIFWCWQPSSYILWRAPPSAAIAINAAFLATWPLLIYSISLTGLGYQTGLTPWWHWVWKKPLPQRPFKVRSLYRCFRHPIYLSFLGLIWLTPTITLDRAILLCIWTIYVYIGSILKDRRLEYYLGQVYRDYATQIPGYPGIRYGLLGRRVEQAPSSAQLSRNR